MSCHLSAIVSSASWAPTMPSKHFPICVTLSGWRNDTCSVGGTSHARLTSSTWLHLGGASKPPSIRWWAARPARCFRPKMEMKMRRQSATWACCSRCSLSPGNRATVRNQKRTVCGFPLKARRLYLPVKWGLEMKSSKWKEETHTRASLTLGSPQGRKLKYWNF